jgi:hypothetical protein
VYNIEVVDIRKLRDIFILLIAEVELFIIFKHKLFTLNSFLGIGKKV